MPTFDDAMSRGAKRLNLPTEVLAGAMSQAGMTHDVWVHVTQDDFVREIEGRLKAKGHTLSGFLLRAAYSEMNQLLQGTPVGLPPGVTAATATIEQLLEVVDVRRPDSDVMQALLDREVGGAKLRSMAFFVLKGEKQDEVELDRQATRAVIELLRRGMPSAPDELLDPAAKTSHVVYSHDELPSTQHLIDPLFPHLDLKLGVSTPHQVLVHPRLNPEQHQLLLFLRLKGKVPEPKDKPACEDLLRELGTRSQADLLDRYGAKGVYAKAARLPDGAPAGLPNVVRTAARPPVASGNEGAGLSRGARAQMFALWCSVHLAGALTVADLRAALTSMGVGAAGQKDVLLDRVEQALAEELEAFAPGSVEAGQALPRLRTLLGAEGLPVNEQQAEVILGGARHLMAM